MSRATRSHREPISPSDIAQSYKLQQCPMYLYHQYVEQDFTGLSDISLSPLLAATGEKFEQSQLQTLLEADVHSVGTDDVDISFDEEWTRGTEQDLDRIRTLIEELDSGSHDRPIVLYQPRIKGKIEAWPVQGDADIVIITPDGPHPGSTIEVRVVEVKSSTSVQTHHQLQAAIYSLLFESLLADFDADVTASVVSQDSNYGDLTAIITGSAGIDLRRLSAFDLETRQNDVQLLLEADGTLDEILLEGLLLLVRLPAERTADDEDGSDQTTDYYIGSPSIHPSHLDLPVYPFMPESWRDIGVPVVIDRGKTRVAWPRSLVSSRGVQ